MPRWRVTRWPSVCGRCSTAPNSNASDVARLRQVALVARALEPVAAALQAEFQLGDPYRDSGVAEFGLENVVFAVGDTFLEVVSPVADGTTAGRYLDRRGGD